MARYALGGPPSGERAVFALLRVMAALVGTLGILVALLYSGYLNYTNLEPPDANVTEHELVVDATGRRVEYGRSWLAREGRIWNLHLEGSPEEIGDAHGKLAARLVHELHQHVAHVLDARYGAWSEAWAANMLLRWQYRGADAHVDEDDRRELAALAASMPDVRAGDYHAYHLLFLHQCFHELAQRLQDAVIQGSMFAVGPRRKNGPLEGNLVVGRTLTVDLGHEFEIDRMVSFYYPDGRYPFVSVGWPGLIGVVTGMNARGIFVALNPARTDDPLEDGSPLPLVVREVLEKADTLEHAVEIFKLASLRTSGIVLVADGVQRKAVVLELAARAADERRLVRGQDEPVVWATDHMTADVFERDPQNDKIRRDTSSGYRFARLAELLGDVSALTPEAAAAILRDRRGVGDVGLGLGNRNALEPLVTTQSVVVDVTAMVLWIAEGPSTLGRYRAFDLRRMLTRDGQRPAPLADLPPDPLLYSEEFRDWEQALESMAYAHYLLARGQPERALSAAQVGLALAPDLGDLHRLVGDILRELGHSDQARAHYERYLELVPGRLRDRERVLGIVAELEK